MRVSNNVQLLAAASVLTAISSALAQDHEPHATEAPATAAPLAVKPIDFNHPPRDYVALDRGTLCIYVEQSIQDDEPELARKAIERLDALRTRGLDALPAPERERLGKLSFFLMHGVKSKNGGRDNGLEYFRPSDPKYHDNVDPRMASSIVIYSAENWAWLPEHRALEALVHELAHAHQLEDDGPEYQPDIYKAWEHARKQGLYRDVRDESGKVLSVAYLLQNHLEYFAELSALYFVGGHHQPFTREELEKYDPDGYAMVRKLWGLVDTGDSSH